MEVSGGKIYTQGVGEWDTQTKSLPSHMLQKNHNNVFRFGCGLGKTTEFFCARSLVLEP